MKVQHLVPDLRSSFGVTDFLTRLVTFKWLRTLVIAFETGHAGDALVIPFTGEAFISVVQLGHVKPPRAKAQS